MPTASCWILLEKPSLAQVLRNFLKCYRIRRFISVNSPFPGPDEFSPQHNLSHLSGSIVITHSHLHLGISGQVFHSGLLSKACRHSSHACYTPYLYYCSWLDHYHYIRQILRVTNSSSCIFLHPPMFASLFGPNNHLKYFPRTVSTSETNFHYLIPWSTPLYPQKLAQFRRQVAVAQSV
jgi:hypothetical protein